VAQAYLAIRREGCIQFDELLVFIYCNPKKVSLQMHFKSIKTTMEAKTDEKSDVRQHCTDLYAYLNECVTKWQENMSAKRRHAEYLKLFSQLMANKCYIHILLSSSSYI